MRAVIIKTTGNIVIKNLPTYESLRKSVGGDIEAIRLCKNATAYLNEDGKAQNLPYNEIATQLCSIVATGLALGDFIVGNMVVCGLPDSEGEDTDIPDDVLGYIELAKGLFQRSNH